ncbi:MAG TPA: hypothetical protein P5256_02155 [Beijerinckiaceae bacterium]|nr:hypothetical protein [Rhodoblastus sp.]MCB1525543.1 hypothetical protein [Rhodoblastus sp.]MCC2108368.1 hypothetical protein [Hyphomicrobiales bacterium]MCO5086696.1 hypothetical protein [Methylobacteriaceae bacterium]HRY01899.1 hypothetical protein [Beijerinckiaceae bacterium]
MTTLAPSIRRIAGLEIAPRSRLATCALLAFGFIVSGLAGAALARHYAGPGLTINVDIKRLPAARPPAHPDLSI